VRNIRFKEVKFMSDSAKISDILELDPECTMLVAIVKLMPLVAALLSE